MKKIFYLFTIALLVASCGSKPKIITYKIKGYSPADEGKKVFLKKIKKDLSAKVIDTAVVKDSVFVFEIPKQNPDLAIIEMEGGNKRLAVILGDGDIQINAEKQFNFSSDITGTTSALTKKFFEYERTSKEEKNEGLSMMQAYRSETDLKKRDSIKNRYENWRNKAVESQYDYIKNNKDMVGLIVLQSLLMYPEAKFDEISKAFNSYPQAVRYTSLGKYVNTTLLTKGATKIGGKAPAFIGTTPEGKKLSLQQAMGKVTLIDFWASWCKPCRMENPYVVQIYNKYHDRGFNIIGVSLDKTKEAWVRAIKDDKLNWQHVSNLKFWNEPIAKLYGVMSIPQTYLLDAKGIIRAKNLRREQLEQKVKELLDE